MAQKGDATEHLLVPYSEQRAVAGLQGKGGPRTSCGLYVVYYLCRTKFTTEQRAVEGFRAQEGHARIH
jgi:hypothetical protein